MLRLIATAIDLYILVIIVRALLSWFRVDTYHPVVRFIYDITEPILSRIRDIVPAIGGLDLSPLILIIILSLLKNLLFAG